MLVTAGVAVENSVYHFDKLFDYIVPQNLTEKALPGSRVTVPFGRGNKTRQGIIMRLNGFSDENSAKLKSLLTVLDQVPVLSKEMLDLAFFMKEHYFCSLYDAVKSMLPVGLNYKFNTLFALSSKEQNFDTSLLSEIENQIISFLKGKRRPIKKEALCSALGFSADNGILDSMVKKRLLTKTEGASRKVQDASVKMVRLCSTDIPKLTPKQQEVTELLAVAGAVSVKEISYFTGTTAAVVNTLVKNGVCEYFQEEVFRTPVTKTYEENTSEIVLTEQQQAAYENIITQYGKKKAAVSLLYGITGSGKTSVFMKAIDYVFAQGKGIIVMVPEISLTPQLVQLFAGRYGDNIAVFHSGLSLGERLDEWKRVKNGQAKIAIGTRSAVFAPFDNLGLIIMDEEQEYTYKSEASPRYHARDVSKYRCYAHNCLLLLSSATPLVDSYYQCEQGKYSINTLNKRYGKAKLPNVIIADMNDEQAVGNNTGISSVLLEGLQENLRQHKQSILLLNRRGHNTFVSCKNCKEVVVCPHCSISLTYHSANNRLMCHYCGYSQYITDECPACHSLGLKFSGMGTQLAEQTVAQLFPRAKILRLDTDATISKYAYEKKLEQFSQGGYDIMIGTQMVAKGLNFPNVTLVGVLSIDQMLYSDDYRSEERTFSLLTQVVGRSGRGEHKGRAVIQTFTPENATILLAANQDYPAFYKNELALRRAMLYPPFSDICMIGFVGESDTKTELAANIFTRELIKLAKEKYADLPLRVLGASPATVTKISNKYRYKVVLKCRNGKSFRSMVSSLLCACGKDNRFSSVTVFADINPDNIL